MLSEDRIEEAVEAFCENNYWSDCYNQAPSAACRRRAALAFYLSMFRDDAAFDLQAYRAEVERVESQFGSDDWEHMLRYSGNNPLRAVYARKVKGS